MKDTMTIRDKMIELVDIAKEEYANDVTDHIDADALQKQIEKRLKEKCDLVDVIAYAMRDFDDYLDECYEEEISPQDTCEDFIADGILRAGYRKQSEGEWISVTERLPRESGKYIVCTNGKNPYQCKFYTYPENKGGHWGQKDNGKNITHWMPFPEPPKTKGGVQE